MATEIKHRRSAEQWGQLFTRQAESGQRVEALCRPVRAPPLARFGGGVRAEAGSARGRASYSEAETLMKSS